MTIKDRTSSVPRWFVFYNVLPIHNDTKTTQLQQLAYQFATSSDGMWHNIHDARFNAGLFVKHANELSGAVDVDGRHESYGCVILYDMWSRRPYEITNLVYGMPYQES